MMSSIRFGSKMVLQGGERTRREGLAGALVQQLGHYQVPATQWLYDDKTVVVTDTMPEQSFKPH